MIFNFAFIDLCSSSANQQLDDRRFSAVFAPLDVNAPRASQETLSTMASQTSILFGNLLPNLNTIQLASPDDDTELDECVSSSGGVSRSNTIISSSRIQKFQS